MLRFCDSFDHYLTADIPAKWPAQSGSPVISAGTGRHSSASLRCPNASSGAATVSKTLDAQGTWIVGVALKLSAVNYGLRTLLALLDGGDVHLALVLQSDGALQVVRGGDAAILGTSATLLAPDVWYFVELRAVLDVSAGEVLVCLDTEAVISASGVRTSSLAAANPTADTLQLGPDSAGNALTVDWDDLYVCDAQGSHNIDVLGDVRVDASCPALDGTYAEWTVSAGVNHADVVDEETPNTTDYVLASVAGKRDSYTLAAFPALSGGGTKGIQINCYAKKDASDARQLKGLIVSGATTEAAAVAQDLSTTYGYLCFPSDVDPHTSAPWTAENLAAAEFGAEVL
jgi:hypothetical protein